jgi:hypothetical protein
MILSSVSEPGLYKTAEASGDGIRPARQVVPPHVHTAFPHLNLARETY